MPLLVRKISRPKWGPGDEFPAELRVVPADALTSCLRTFSNALSVWEVANDDEVENVVLAIASQFDKPAALDVAWFDGDVLDAKEFRVKRSAGVTPLESMVGAHRDVEDLDYDKLGEFAEVIIECLREVRWRRYREAKVRELLVRAVEVGRLKQSALSDRLVKRLGLGAGST